ncbi:MAG: hypothetical protein ACPLSK_04355, partial [bacterium]
MAFITGFLVVLVAGCGGGGGGISQSVSSLPRLQVVGNEIRDENGNRLVLKGVNALDPASMVKYYNHFGEEYFKKMREWG